MPTGYTADVKDDTTMAEFAMKCARAFGALVTMRDDPSDAPIPDGFEPSNYHVEQLAKDRPRLLELEGMTDEQAAPFAEAEFKSERAKWKKRNKENAATAARYGRLLGLVRGWKPPTAEHKGLKDFMVEQLTTSIEHDCYNMEEPQRKTPAEWRASALSKARWSVSYHEKENAAEIERARSRTNWIKQLRASLARPEAGPDADLETP